MEKHYYTYILECDNNSYYTGYTVDIEKRYKAHVSGKGAKYTRMHKPIGVAYIKRFDTKSDAMKHECEIKAMNHKQKEELIKEFEKKQLMYAFTVCMGAGGLPPC